MLNSPGTGLERAGLPRSTSIIEKLTNVTYASGDQEDDARLVLSIVEKTQEQDISPEIKSAKKTNSSKKRRERKHNRPEKFGLDSPSIDL